MIERVCECNPLTVSRYLLIMDVPKAYENCQRYPSSILSAEMRDELGQCVSANFRSMQRSRRWMTEQSMEKSELEL